MHNVIWANKKTESFVYFWLCAHTVFDVTCYPAFVGASKVISSVLSIRQSPITPSYPINPSSPGGVVRVSDTRVGVRVYARTLIVPGRVETQVI